MLNEWDKFLSYTGKLKYQAFSKQDTSYLGHFTFLSFTDFEGLGRVLTTVARGYLFHDGGEHQLSSDPYSRIPYARDALCAWCSVPERNVKTSDEVGVVNFGKLSEQFPELVNPTGRGWFYQHEQRILRFIRSNPECVSISAQKKAETLAKSFTEKWKKKVRQMQVPPLNVKTKGAWILRFEDILADALELGPLQNQVFSLSAEMETFLEEQTPKGIPPSLLPMLTKYYYVNCVDDEEWVVLPISAVDACYSNNSFSKRWKKELPGMLVQFKSSYDICKFRMCIPESLLK